MKPLLKCLLTIIVALVATSTPRTCSAQTLVPNLVAPPLSFCIGETDNCVMPDFNLSTVSYDLSKKKWDAGVKSIGVGYALLFSSTKQWASGFAVHAAGQWSQSSPSYFALTPTLVIAKYFEVGATFSFMDGSIGKSITLGLGLGGDVLSGQTMATRFTAAKASQKAPPQPQ